MPSRHADLVRARVGEPRHRSRALLTSGGRANALVGLTALHRTADDHLEPSVVGAIAPHRPTCGNDDRHGDERRRRVANGPGRSDGARAGSIAAPFGGGPPAGQVPSAAVPDARLDDADLVATLRAELERHGVRADDLRCPSGLRAEVGESVRCTFTVDGQPVAAVARITAVER
jgi:hypothetical protein